MQIPDSRLNDATFKAIKELWEKSALQIGLETGVFVSVEFEYEEYPRFKRICFKAAGHEFENIMDLKKALNNKAFL